MSGTETRGRGRRGRGGGGAGNRQPNGHQRSASNGAEFKLERAHDFSTQAAPRAPLPGSSMASHLATSSFASLSDRVDGRILSSIPFESMSDVQSASLDPALSGKDVLVQAKTGTGKTIAYLLPSLQRLLSGPPSNGQHVRLLVLSPTRELALQIQREAEMLLQGLRGVLGSQCVIGGSNINTERQLLQRQRKDILIATPGRLMDHLQTSNLASSVSRLQILVADEADRMFDMGFRPVLEQIQTFLPTRSQGRQTLLFSATVPKGLKETARLAQDAAFVNCLSEEEANVHKHIKQQYVLAPLADQLAMALHYVLQDIKINGPESKPILFFQTARSASLAHDVFETRPYKEAIAQAGGKNFEVCAIHSRMSQGARVRNTNNFAAGKSGVLLSSDVAARGVDFPGVSLVLQLGAPSEVDQYIHRVGRTGRAGAGGSGMLVLNDFEGKFVQKAAFKELPVTKIDRDAAFEDALGYARQVYNAAIGQVGDDEKAATYRALMGYLNGEKKWIGWDSKELVVRMNEYAIQGLRFAEGSGSLPGITPKAVGMMSLKVSDVVWARAVLASTI
ncbi:DEAD-domain-containing protein [Ceraceosorus guamensis]|uniref:ATP-dependent RNA helicase n=1 Tax=Ceraceosorus guamensis TaxID=1522189 RepID=A0A316VRQ7_9BASI|nr:DEAD-domain-containing protein [Ceraceosorus guamensis]PWN40192.1 DEAD-domain-containing protein [Ceraceosorus guamensis]